MEPRVTASRAAWWLSGGSPPRALRRVRHAVRARDAQTQAL